MMDLGGPPDGQSSLNATVDAATGALPARGVTPPVRPSVPPVRPGREWVRPGRPFPDPAARPSGGWGTFKNYYD